MKRFPIAFLNSPIQSIDISFYPTTKLVAEGSFTNNNE